MFGVGLSSTRELLAVHGSPFRGLTQADCDRSRCGRRACARWSWPGSIVFAWRCRRLRWCSFACSRTAASSQPAPEHIASLARGPGRADGDRLVLLPTFRMEPAPWFRDEHRGRLLRWPSRRRRRDCRKAAPSGEYSIESRPPGRESSSRSPCRSGHWTGCRIGGGVWRNDGARRVPRRHGRRSPTTASAPPQKRCTMRDAFRGVVLRLGGHAAAASALLEQPAFIITALAIVIVCNPLSAALSHGSWLSVRTTATVAMSRDRLASLFIW